MVNRVTMLLVACASGLLLAAMVSSASANRLSVSESQKVTYSPLSFVPSGGNTVRCPVTLEETVTAREYNKIPGNLIGFVGRASVGTCEAGVMRLNTETLAWEVDYVGFTGTLPTITSVSKSIIRMSFEVGGESLGLSWTCRYTVPNGLVISSRETRGVITSESRGSENIRSETAACPSGRLSGTGRVTTLGGGSVSLSLIF